MSKRALTTRLFAICLSLALFTNSGWAYYYFVHYSSQSAPFVPLPEKFDLTTLQNNTVYFYIDETGPSATAPGDSFTAIVSEIRTAALIWNTVPTSTIKLAYGGFYTPGSGLIKTGVTVEFSDELPPGVIARGAPITFTGGPNGQFVPIQTSTILVQKDLSQPQTACSNAACPSFSEYFFTTLVHEFGHTLGLQHTFTSSVMSTYVTSAVTKAAPLGTDDVMGISLLYPTNDFASKVGTITGTVMANGSAVSMASVVAISPGNPAISSMTNPDGTYSITVPPGAYEVYVHPVPPPLQNEITPGNIVWPLDQNGNSFPLPSSVFQTQFYPGTQDFLAASNVFVNPASVSSGVNFNVSSKPYVTLSSIRTYGYSSTSVPIASPPIAISSAAAMVAYGGGLMKDAKNVTPGLSISAIGSGAASTLQVYNVQPWVDGYIAFDVALGYFAGIGPKHLLFRTPDDIYVLPSAFAAVNLTPPFISSVNATSDGNGGNLAVVSGNNLWPNYTQILFDGLPGTVTGTMSDGSLIVVPPPGPGGYQAVVTALNQDGQSSNYLESPNPPYYTYAGTPAPSVAVSPATLSPGTNTVDVTGTNTNFVDGQVFAGFETSNAVVTGIKVIDATHLAINVTLNSSTNVAATSINIVNGLQLIAASQGSVVTEQSKQSTKY